MSSYIESIVASNTNVVFCFGGTGVGKTCFLSVMLYYLYKNHKLKYNAKYNPEGIEYLNDLLDGLSVGKLPDPTSLGQLEEIDLQFTLNQQTATLTFLDVSGEELRVVKAGESDPLTNKKGRGEMAPRLARYFNNEDVNVTVLCFAEYGKPRESDVLISAFFNFIESHYEFDFKRAAVVITKWDKNTSERELLQFMIDETPQSYFWLDDMTANKNAFEFSIGKVSPDNQLLVKLDLQYCTRIIEWLHSTCDFQFVTALEEEQGKELSKKSESGIVNKLLKAIFGTANPISEIREWIKMLLGK